MADALKLAEVADSEGFLRRVEHLLLKKSRVVLDAGTPVDDVTLAKALAWTGNVDDITRRFARMLVSDTEVANALDTNAYDHKQLSDAAAETQIDDVWTSFVKATV